MSIKKLDVIDQKIDKVDRRLNSIDITLTSQHEVLKEHIRRTELLETKVAPLDRDISMFKGALKFIGLLSAVAVIVEVLLLFRK